MQEIRQLGRYEISRLLTETPWVSIYAAWDPGEKRAVSLGIPHMDGGTALGLKRMDHPGWIAVLRAEEERGVPFLVMEPFEGTPLEEAVLQNGRELAFGDVIKILTQMAGALDYAHSRGLVHGSLHPAEVLANDRSEVKMLYPEAEERPERLLRAVHYLSPERLRSITMDGRSDQFSLAVLTHRLLTGELPFPGDSAVGVTFRILFHAIEAAPMRTLPADARRVLERALDGSAARRYPSCGEMVEALGIALTKRTVASPTRVLDSPDPFASGAAIPPGLPLFVTPPGIFRSGATWFGGRRASLKLFGAAFGVCVVLLSAALYIFLLFAHPKPNLRQSPVLMRAVVPQASQTVKEAPKKETPLRAATGRTEKRRVAKPAPQKEPEEPEVILKPVEPTVVQP